MASPNMSDCVSIGFAVFKRNPLTHIISTLLVSFVGGATMGVLTGPMMVGYMRMIEKEVQGGKAEVGEIFQGFDDFVPALVAILISGLVASIGFFFCFLPGLLVVALIPTSVYLVACGEKDGTEAFKKAWVVVKENLLSACLCMLVLSFVGSVGSLLCGVGILLTMPIAMIGMQVMAKQLVDDAPPLVIQL